MNGHRRCIAAIATLIVVAAGLWAFADSTLDVKRRLALDLIKEGKTFEAVGLLREIIATDPDNYKDHLAVARCNDKLGRSDDAVSAYRKVSELLQVANSSEERMARIEAEKRIKLLDAGLTRVIVVEDEFLRKLDQVERDVALAKDLRALERIFRLRGAVLNLQGRNSAGGIEVQAGGNWQECNITASAGQTFIIRAVGKWNVGKSVCGPDGDPKAGLNADIPKGTLLVGLSTNPGFFAPVGSMARIKVPQSGKLRFVCNMATEKERVQNTGNIYVLIQPE